MPPTIIVLPGTVGTYQYLAREVGVTVQLPADIIQNLTGATACNVQVVGPTGMREALITATPSSDGTNATFTTAATTFPVAGTYKLELQATFTNGEVLAANEVDFVVGPRV